MLPDALANGLRPRHGDGFQFQFYHAGGGQGEGVRSMFSEDSHVRGSTRVGRRMDQTPTLQFSCFAVCSDPQAATNAKGPAIRQTCQIVANPAG
jgi:hypothetical protein